MKKRPDDVYRQIVRDMELHLHYRVKKIAARHDVCMQTIAKIWRNRDAIKAGQRWKYRD